MTLQHGRRRRLVKRTEAAHYEQIIRDLKAELAATYEELIGYVGDDMEDSTSKRIAKLREGLE